MATWATLIALLSVHLATNYAAVTAVSMRSLNRQRANIVLSRVLQGGEVLGPAEVSKRERVFERDGVLRWADDRIVGRCRIGVPLEKLLRNLGQRHNRTGSTHLQAIKMSELLSLYDDEAYLLWFAQSEATIVLKLGCTPIDQLKAWSHALLLAQRMAAKAANRQANDVRPTRDSPLAEVRSALEDSRRMLDNYAGKLRDAGWDLDIAALETRAGTRASIANQKK